MKRTQIIRARCTAEEKQVLDQMARIERRNPSETVRELIRQAAKSQGLWPPKNTGKETPGAQ